MGRGPVYALKVQKATSFATGGVAIPWLLIGAGTGDERLGAERSEKALASYRSVRATRYIRQAEALLASTQPKQEATQPRV
jgi:hypothetical protein